MTETIEVIFRDAMLVLRPAPVGQALVTLLEAQMVVSGKRLVLLGVPARQPLKQRTMEK